MPQTWECSTVGLMPEMWECSRGPSGPLIASVKGKSR